MNGYGRNDHLNLDQAKNIIKEIIKNSKSGEFSISGDIYLYLQQTAIKLGYIEDPQSMHTSILSRNDEMKCIDEMWNYVLRGILSPGVNQNYRGSKFFPYLHLTELGKYVMENQDYDPYSSENYLNKLMEFNSDLIDDLAHTLLIESLRSFKLNCYFGSVVLLGMCVETIFEHFINDLKKFVKIDMSYTISMTFKNLLDSLKPKKAELPSNIGQNLELWLSEFFNYIRQTRSELHQPIVNNFSREEVYGIFLKFPTLLDKLICLLNYFKNDI